MSTGGITSVSLLVVARSLGLRVSGLVLPVASTSDLARASYSQQRAQKVANLLRSVVTGKYNTSM